MAFACKLAVFGAENNIDSKYEKNFNDFFHLAYFYKEIRENEANVIFLFAKFFERLYFPDRAIKIAEDFKKLVDVLLGRQQGLYFDLIEELAWNNNDLIEKINDVSFHYVQNEGDPSFDEFQSGCASLSEHDYPAGEIFDKHSGLNISEETRFLAGYFSSKYFKCDRVETRDHECLNMLETIFNDRFMIKCRKPHASLSLHVFQNR